MYIYTKCIKLVSKFVYSYMYILNKGKRKIEYIYSKSKEDRITKLITKKMVK